jgi:predicted alpha/beta-fold hydrolase
MKTYKPEFLFKFRDVNTVYPTFFRNVKVDYKRERIELKDGDFLDIDRIKNGNKKVAVLCHGLEGSSNSNYIKAVASLLNKNEFDITAVNYRSCSGEMNRLSKFYHAGATDDLKEVVNHIEPEYDEVYLVGYSLGANLVLKYMGVDAGKDKKLKAGVAISCPLDLYDSSFTLNKTRNYVYKMKFLLSLKKKIREKYKMMPDKINIEGIDKLKDFNEFDNRYTAKLNGFKDAEDYYKKESAINFLPDIKVPALIINAKDDPILSSKCYPKHLKEINENLNILYPKYGGHVGFAKFNKDYYWTDYKVLDFFKHAG